MLIQVYDKQTELIQLLFHHSRIKFNTKEIHQNQKKEKVSFLKKSNSLFLIMQMYEETISFLHDIKIIQYTFID